MVIDSIIIQPFPIFLWNHFGCKMLTSHKHYQTFGDWDTQFQIAPEFHYTGWAPPDMAKLVEINHKIPRSNYDS